MDYEIGDRIQFRLDGDPNNMKDGTVITEENDEHEFNVEYEDDWGTKKIISFDRYNRKAGFKNIDAGIRIKAMPKPTSAPADPNAPLTPLQRFARDMEAGKALGKPKSSMGFVWLIGGAIALFLIAK